MVNKTKDQILAILKPFPDKEKMNYLREVLLSLLSKNENQKMNDLKEVQERFI